MQNESLSSPAYGNIGAASAKSPESHNGDGFGLYSPFVLAQERPFREPSMNVNDALYYSRLLMQQQQQQQQHQDMVNRHSLCLTRLREAAKDAEILRQENASLRSVNRELNKHIGLLIKSSVTVNDHHHHHHLPAASSNDFDNINSSAATTSFENMVNVGMRGLSIGGGGGGGGGDHREEVCVESPTSVMENVDVKRVSLPKSISVRSNGYLKIGPPPPPAAAADAVPASNNSKARPRAAAPLTSAQKVYVRGGKREEEPLELEVYNQGMFKTELCNKWQETGACPYGDHCQFAHGIEELRPVIRHPRYKTEVCRMVLAGDVCPYGHRCHFRHALTDQERFMGHMNPRSIKLN